MAYQEGLHNQEAEGTDCAGTFSEGCIEDLRKILEAQQQRPVSHDEAAEIGDSLVSFFEVLAEVTSGDSVSNLTTGIV